MIFCVLESFSRIDGSVVGRATFENVRCKDCFFRMLSLPISFGFHSINWLKRTDGGYDMEIQFDFDRVDILREAIGKYCKNHPAISVRERG